MDQTKISALAERVAGYLNQNNDQEKVDSSEVARILEGNENKAREIENLFKIMDAVNNKFNLDFTPSRNYGAREARENIEYLLVDVIQHLHTSPIPSTLIGRSSKTNGTYIAPGEYMDNVSLGTLDEDSNLIRKMFNEKSMDLMVYCGEVGKEYVASRSNYDYNEVKNIDPDNLKEIEGGSYNINPFVAKLLDPSLGNNTPLIFLAKINGNDSLDLDELRHVMKYGYNNEERLERALGEFLIESRDSGWLRQYMSDDRNFIMMNQYAGEGQSKPISVKTINERTGEYEEFTGKASELLLNENLPEKISRVISNLYNEHCMKMYHRIPDEGSEKFKNFGAHIRSYLTMEAPTIFETRKFEHSTIQSMIRSAKASFFWNQDLMRTFAILNEVGKQVNDGKQLQIRVFEQPENLDSWLHIQPNMGTFEVLAEKINERVPCPEGMKPLVEKSSDFNTFLLNINDKSYALSMLDPQEAIKNISIADEITRREEIIAQNSLNEQGKSIIDGIINDESEVKNNNIDL